MLESMTIFNKGGLVLYQYTASPTVMDTEKGGGVCGGGGGASYTQSQLNRAFFPVLLDPGTPKDKTYLIVGTVTFCWKELPDFLVVAIYPDILFEGPRLYLKEWATSLVQKTAQEYQQYFDAVLASDSATEDNNNEEKKKNEMDWLIQAPDPKPFDKVFRILLDQSKNQKQSTTTTADTTAATSSSSLSAKQEVTGGVAVKKGGKEKRNWHDGKAKMTKEAMEGLDMSKKETDEDKATAQDRALQEARAAYLPTEEDIKQQQSDPTTEQSSSSSTTTSSIFSDLFAHLTGTKVLTDADLEVPLQKMQELLTSKNVAAEIAEQLCAAVRLKLRGKTLTQLYRVQTAVQQALEATVSQLLQRHSFELLHAVLDKKQQQQRSSMFTTTKQQQTPYTIVVIGINGVGKSTSLAKLTYYLKQNGCRPLLVAGDTFRSGAVEQLSVHANCLEVPLFSQGYSKDPSAVAKAAIQQAVVQGNDVVLIDTAGRMQNNAPLMKALGKLVMENQPDCILLVCEALVGHDGLDQFSMFQKALGQKRKLDGLILTKFDTVSDKVGAALTLTHQTGAPILFCGTGQKYHHLQKLNAPTIVQALFSS